MFNREYNLNIKNKIKSERLQLTPLKNRNFYFFDFAEIKDLDPVSSSFTKKRVEEEQASIKTGLRHLYFDMNNIERILFDRALSELDELKLFHNIIDE